ncbi:hypothetical protein HH310_19775 [Actinoplanes sp. TBRC 11911]|nr:hypothetical protein [Actinoplanes sp. TBRC 11911]NMO53416.1 hypothetical protein [Actinoplanes sp. TBRC 11911]
MSIFLAPSVHRIRPELAVAVGVPAIEPHRIRHLLASSLRHPGFRHP